MAKSKASPKPKARARSGPVGADTTWFVRDRFGLFIHWGLYALGARHEWLQHRESIPAEVYRKYFDHFDPDLYDPAVWAAAAAGAGMKYYVITTKHHEGFCLWDSDLTDYKAPNTPCGRDLLRPMVEAFRAAGLRTGFYHSLIDWHHDQYLIDPYIGPYRESPDRAAMNASRDQRKYAAYLKGQVRELLTRYGQVDIMWFDFSFPGSGPEGKGRDAWQSADLVAMIRELAPQIILDDRLDLPGVGDIKTPEQFQPRAWPQVDGRRVVWEACQTFAGSWGYHRDESSWRSVENLVQTLIDCVSKGGNLLLNVGPTGRGEFDARALDRLAGVGAWMKRHGRSIYGCTEAPAGLAVRDGRLTWNPATRRLYVHCFAWPYKHLYIDGLDVRRVLYAQLLHDASEVPLKGLEDWQQHAAGADTCAGPSTAITLPQTRPDAVVPVVELHLRD
jgi:alpha-L-fucosidase